MFYRFDADYRCNRSQTLAEFDLSGLTGVEELLTDHKVIAFAAKILVVQQPEPKLDLTFLKVIKFD